MFEKLIESFNAAIDYFVHESFKADTDMRYKVRLLVGSVLAFMIGVVCFGPYYSSIDSLPGDAIAIYYIYAVPLIAFWAWLLNMLKNGKGYRFCSQAVLASCGVVLFSGIFVTGGPAETEVLPLVIIPVIMAFLLLGQRDGLIWGFLIAAVNYMFVAMDYLGFNFIQMAHPDAMGQLRIFNWSYFFFTTLSLVMIYESMNRRLTNERNAERERFRHMAMHDSLTGLPNRKYFDDAVISTLALASRSNNRVAVGLLDLNGFKPINDEIGHDAGDIVLQVVSERLDKVLRKSDKIARLGGDEFALILNNVKNKDDIANVAEKVLSAISRPIELNMEECDRITVSGSLGIAVFPDDSEDENHLRTMSDKAMYHAKRNKSGWCLHSELTGLELGQEDYSI